MIVYVWLLNYIARPYSFNYSWEIRILRILIRIEKYIFHRILFLIVFDSHLIVCVFFTI